VFWGERRRASILIAAVIILPLLLRHVIGDDVVDTEHDIVRGLLLLVCKVILL